MLKEKVSTEYRDEYLLKDIERFSKRLGQSICHFVNYCRNTIASSLISISQQV